MSSSIGMSDMWVVRIDIPRAVLMDLTSRQFRTFMAPWQPNDNFWNYLGFEKDPEAWSVWRPPSGDPTFVLQCRTAEVVAPALFGHKLPYTAERIREDVRPS